MLWLTAVDVDCEFATRFGHTHCDGEVRRYEMLNNETVVLFDVLWS